MRWKIQFINLGSKKTRQIKKLEEYIDGIASKIQLFVNDLGEESETMSLTPVERLSKTGDFILELQQEILKLRRNKYHF